MSEHTRLASHISHVDERVFSQPRNLAGRRSCLRVSEHRVQQRADVEHLDDVRSGRRCEKLNHEGAFRAVGSEHAVGEDVGFAVWSFFNVLSAEPTWSSFAARVLVTATFGLLAAYAGRQGERAQRRARDDEELALKLAALGPFLAPLPEERQHEVRLKMAEISFGRPVASDRSDADSNIAVGIPGAPDPLAALDKFAELVRLLKGSWPASDPACAHCER